MAAVQDTVDAAGDVGTAAEDFCAGNDGSAWDALGAAGHKAVGAMSNFAAQVRFYDTCDMYTETSSFAKGVDDATNAALTGIAGAGLAAVQAIPGADLAVDAGVAAYAGYKV